MKKKTILKNIGIYLLFLLTVAVIFITHRNVPFMMDDLWYSTVLSDDTPLTGLADVLHAQIWHYCNWGGRSMTHTILQLTLMQGELFADILNTLVTILLAFLIWLAACDIAGQKVKADSGTVLALTLIMGCLHGLNANWEMSMYWQAGSANYLYIAVFLVLFAWVYVRECRETAPKPLKGITVWIIPLAILAGWSNENMGPTVWLISLFTILYLRKKKRPVRAWMILGSIFSLAGSAACILAPGNFVRSAEAEEEGKGLVWKIYLRFYAECKGAFDYLFPVLVLTLVAAGICFGAMKKKADLQTLIYAIAAVVACGAMILSPHFPDRATFGSMVFLLIALVSLSIRMERENEKTKLWIFLSGLLIWLHGMFYLAEFLGMSWGWIS